MQVEELLQMLQERGMSDDDIKGLLDAAMKTLGNDFEEHDEKIDEEKEKAEASQLLGVEL